MVRIERAGTVGLDLLAEQSQAYPYPLSGLLDIWSQAYCLVRRKLGQKEGHFCQNFPSSRGEAAPRIVALVLPSPPGLPLFKATLVASARLRWFSKETEITPIICEPELAARTLTLSPHGSSSRTNLCAFGPSSHASRCGADREFWK